MAEQSFLAVEGVGLWQTCADDPFRRVSIADNLIAGQGSADQKRSGIGSQVFRFVGPLRNEGPEIESRRDLVFVQVKRRETVRRIPAATALLCKRWIKRVGPGRIGDTPPGMAVRQLLGLTLHVEPNSLVLEAARRTDENGRDVPPEDAFPTEFCGTEFDKFFWDLIRDGISENDRVDGEEMVRLQQLIRDILGVLADWLSSSPGLVPVPNRQANVLGERLGGPGAMDLTGLPHAVWNQMVLACCIRGPELQPPETMTELARSAAELGLWEEMLADATWRRPSADRIDQLVEGTTTSWTNASMAAASHVGVSPDAARLAVHLVTVPTDLVLWVLSTLPVSNRRLKSTLVRELPRRLGQSLAHMADFPLPFRQLFDAAVVTHLGACLHLGRDSLPTAHVWPATVPADRHLLTSMLSQEKLSEATEAIRASVENSGAHAAVG